MKKEASVDIVQALKVAWRLFLARPWFVASFAPLVAFTLAFFGVFAFELPTVLFVRWSGEEPGMFVLLLILLVAALRFVYDILTNFYSQLVSQLFYLKSVQSPWPTYRSVLKSGLDFHLFVYFAGAVLLNMLISFGILLAAALVAGVLLLFVAPAWAAAVGALIAVGASWYIFTRLMFVHLYVLDQRTNPLDAIRWSWERTRPIVRTLLLWPLIGLLLVFLGLLAFGVGIFVVVFILPLAQAVLYLQLQGYSLPELPAPSWKAFVGYVLTLLLVVVLLAGVVIVLDQMASDEKPSAPLEHQETSILLDTQTLA